MVVWTLLRPQDFEWKVLAKAGISEDERGGGTGGEQ